VTFAARPHTRTFATVVRTYSTGAGATDTVPTGASSVIIEAWGGGASGEKDSVGGPGTGGGGGSYCSRTIACIGGNTLTYTVAQSVAGASTNGPGTNGNLSSVTGTVSGGSVTMTANGGSSGGTGGFGGSATGGTVNTNGADALNEVGGAGAGPGGGSGGGLNAAGNPLGGGGGGATAGSSGQGARGQVQFTYN